MSASACRANEGMEEAVRSASPPVDPAGLTTSAVGIPPPPVVTAASLTEAAAAGDTLLVRDLLARGAAVNGHDEHGVTPVMAAARGNHLDTARTLLAAGADVNLKDETQENAFSIAAISGHLEILKLTIAAGAEANTLNRFNGTALIAASDRGHVEVVRELLSTTVNINHVNRLGWTALLEAVILGDGGPRHTEIVRLLIAAGADTAIGDNNGVTALEHARARGYREMTVTLESARRR